MSSLSNPFELRLEENAIDSLVHAIEHLRVYIDEYQSRELKYTILHTFHAIELFLKNRLAKSSNTLVFSSPNKKEATHIVYFEEAVKRLETIGVIIDDILLSEIRLLKDVRNTIEHYEVSVSANDAEHHVGRAVYFLDAFLESELSINLRASLEDRLSDDVYSDLLDRVYTYSEWLAVSGREMDRYSDDPMNDVVYERERCPACGELRLLIPDPRSTDGSTLCFFCGATPRVYECELCAGTIIMALSENSDEYPDDDDWFDTAYCEDCQDNYIFGRD